jgi:HEAT repeat protein
MQELENLLAELTSGDDERAEAAVSGLASLGPAALPTLRGLLIDDSADTRWWAVRALTEIADAQVPVLLAGALRDDEPSVRQCAALGLRKQPDPQVVPALIATLVDRDHLCRALAADALAAIGEPAVLELLEVMKTGQQPARLEAARALALIGDHRSIPALIAALEEESALMEHWASEGLERMGVGMSFFKP